MVNVPMLAIQELAVHKSIETTQRYCTSRRRLRVEGIHALSSRSSGGAVEVQVRAAETERGKGYLLSRPGGTRNR